MMSIFKKVQLLKENKSEDYQKAIDDVLVLLNDSEEQSLTDEEGEGSDDDGLVGPRPNNRP
jgi:hypothetical protein